MSGLTYINKFQFNFIQISKRILECLLNFNHFNLRPPRFMLPISYSRLVSSFYMLTGYSLHLLYHTYWNMRGGVNAGHTEQKIEWLCHIAVTSRAPLGLKSPATRSFLQQFVLANIITLLTICEGNPPVAGGFPSQRASNEETISMSWRYHEPSIFRHHRSSLSVIWNPP